MRARGRTFSMRTARCFLGLMPRRERTHLQIATDAGKPFFHVPFPTSLDAESIDKVSSEFRGWLTSHKIRILNVAGNREFRIPGCRNSPERF